MADMTERYYDVVIVGAGPAGSNLARLLDGEKYKVLLLDGSENGEKVCGGLLSPDAQDILARYDMNIPTDVLASPQLFSVKTIDLRDGLTRYYRRSYYNVDRKKFDEFLKGMAKAVPDARLGDISAAVQEWAEANGFSVVREYVGHGVGRDLHEDPSIPNYGTAGRGVRLRSGMTLAIEPMINVGVYEVKVLPDKWTVVTADGKLSAHYENTVAVTDNGPVILTALA